MNSKLFNKYSENFIPRLLEITAVATILFYILFSVIKRFTVNEKLFWIPLVLFAANFLILAEVFLMVKRNKVTPSKKEYRNLIGQGILNLAFVIFMLTYVL